MLKSFRSTNPFIKSALLLSLLFMAFNAFSQTDYLVTNDGDTLYGEVRPQSFSNMATDKLILVRGKEKTGYNSLEAIRFVKDGEMYATIKHDNRYKYMMEVSSGYLSVYKFRLDDTYQYSGTILVKSDGQQMVLPNLGYKKAMTQFLSDCGEVVKKLNDKEYKKSQFDQLVSDYNNCIKNKTEIMSANARMDDKTEIAPAVQERISEIRRLSDLLEDEEKKTELNDLIDNLEGRLQEGQAIPGYLSGALRELTEKNEELKIAAEGLLEAINKD